MPIPGGMVCLAFAKRPINLAPLPLTAQWLALMGINFSDGGNPLLAFSALETNPSAIRNESILELGALFIEVGCACNAPVIRNVISNAAST